MNHSKTTETDNKGGDGGGARWAACVAEGKLLLRCASRTKAVQRVGVLL
jgi:hypothetical protein